MYEESWSVDGKPVYVLQQRWWLWSYRIGNGRWRHTFSRLTAVNACTLALGRARRAALQNVGLVRAGEYVLSAEDIKAYYHDHLS